MHNEHLDNLLARLQIDLNFFEQDFDELKNFPKNTLSGFQLICLELLEQQRKLLYEMNRHAEFDEDVIRKYHSIVDVEEYKLREKLIQ